MNRRRLKCETGVTRTQCEHALHTLYYVLDTVARLMAPFAPYQSELIYTQLSRLLPPDQRRASVHHTDVPTAE
jgi:isoleucyl-tRNA synthetase